MGPVATMYAMFMFAIGAGGTAMIILWAAGPVGRTFMFARIMGKRVLEIPRDDRSIDYVRPKVDSKGRWVYMDKGETEIYPVDPEDVNIAEGGIRLVTGIDKHSITTHAEKAVLAEVAEEGEGEYTYQCTNEDCGAAWTGFEGKLNLCPTCKTPGDLATAKCLNGNTTTLKYGKRSINWAKVKARAGELVGPGSVAGILGAAYRAHNPVPDAMNKGMDKNTKLAIGLIIVVVAVGLIGYAIAKSQGII